MVSLACSLLCFSLASPHPCKPCHPPSTLVSRWVMRKKLVVAHFAFPYLAHHHHCRQVCSPPVSKRASKPSKHLRSDLPPRCSLDSLQPLLEPEGRLIKVCNNRSAELCFVVHLLALLILLLAGWQHLLHSGWAVAHLLLLILFVVHLPQHLSPRPAPRLSNVDEVILI